MSQGKATLIDNNGRDVNANFQTSFAAIIWDRIFWINDYSAILASLLNLTEVLHILQCPSYEPYPGFGHILDMVFTCAQKNLDIINVYMINVSIQVSGHCILLVLEPVVLNWKKWDYCGLLWASHCKQQVNLCSSDWCDRVIIMEFDDWYTIVYIL